MSHILKRITKALHTLIRLIVCTSCIGQLVTSSIENNVTIDQFGILDHSCFVGKISTLTFLANVDIVGGVNNILQIGLFHNLERQQANSKLEQVSACFRWLI